MPNPKIVYNFNENSTSTIRDYSENGNDGTGSGLSTANSSRVGKDMVFTDSNNQINLSNVTYLNSASNICVHLSIKIGANIGTKRILHKSGLIQINILSLTSRIEFVLTDSAASIGTLTASYGSNFHDYDLVLLGTNITLYKDGVSVDTATITDVLASNSNNMYIGYDGSTNSGAFNLNEFKLYNQAVTTDNIDAWIEEQNGVYSDSGMDGEYNVGDVVQCDALGTPKYGVISWVGTNSEFRFYPISSNISSGKVFRRVAHLWDTDRQYGLKLEDGEICVYDGMGKSSEVFSAAKKVICFNKNGIVKTSVTKTANYTVISSDQRIYVDSSGGAFNLTLESSPATDRKLEVIDESGNCGTYNVTIEGSGNNINGNSSVDMAVDYDYFILTFNGSTWNKK